MDYIGVKMFSPNGKMTGELRIVGLFTSTAYTRSARRYPYLRRKIAAWCRAPASIRTVIPARRWPTCWSTYPRDELFQIDEDTLYDFSLAILQLDERPRVRVLARRDRFDRFVSVLVYVPRERYDSQIRAKIGAYLANAFIGRVSAFYPYLSGRRPLVRVHFIIGRSGGRQPDIDAGDARARGRGNHPDLERRTQRGAGARQPA